MASTNFAGPLVSIGHMGKLPACYGTGAPVPDPNPDAGPCVFFQGEALPDVRAPILKDQVSGVPGSILSHLSSPTVLHADQIPAAASGANIAALQNAVSGVPMVLAGASVGVALNIPLASVLGTIVNPALLLDFGFAWGSVTAGSNVIQVADSTQFYPGMSLVVGAAGNSAGNAPLMTMCTGIVDPTHISVLDAPLATNATVPIGAGNTWAPRQGIVLQEPTAHLPYMAAGVARLLDPAQAITRGVRIVGVAAGVGGTFTVAGFDLYGQAQTEIITVGAGAVTGWGKKTWKGIASITPNFTDAHTYSAGTSDVFGFALRNDRWEYNTVHWAAALLSPATGWLAADKTNPATSTTGDVRGTIQVSSNGGGAGAGGAASNGAVAALAMTGNRMVSFSNIPQWNLISATMDNPASLYGVTPA